ncbi:hypothetical protein AB0B66_10510 [Catellatospora sp. NPDC049111]|uniref:hypothetical protein n=1 Tax=Catellatospora sp. NPDC049111 TaxID=3155271 RepID=UPI0033C73FAB
MKGTDVDNQYPPDHLRQYIRNAARFQNTDTAHAAAHILCSTDLPERQGLLLPHLIVSLQGTSNDMYTTARVKNWDNLLTELTCGTPDGMGSLLRLARSLADGTAVDLQAACRGLSVRYAGIVSEAVLIAAGHQARYVHEPVTDPDMRQLSDVAHVLHTRIAELAITHHDHQIQSLARDDTAGAAAVKTIVDTVGQLALRARNDVLQRLAPAK